MKKGTMRSWRGIALAVACVAWALAASAAPAKAKARAAKPAEPAGPQQVELVHHLDAVQAAALRELVTRFNESSKDYQVVVSERDWKGGPLPDLAILDGGESEDLVGAGAARYKPIEAVMREAGLPLQKLKAPMVMTRTPVDPRGRLLALPVGLSTPVLFVNRDAFRRAGLDPAAPISTWAELQQALGQLFDKGQKCPYTVADPGQVMVENLSAWHNEPVWTRHGKLTTASFNGMLQIKHVALMASWYRARYLHIFDDPGQAEQRFADGECAVIAAPSAAWPDFHRDARFDIGVLRLPYHEDFPGAPQNTLADGSAMWVAAGRRPAQYKAVARFVAFWLKPENQLAWQQASGFLPLNRAGFLAGAKEVPGDEPENVRIAMSELTLKPATAASAFPAPVWRERVRRIVDEELDAVWADRKPAKQALDDAVTRAGSF